MLFFFFSGRDKLFFFFFFSSRRRHTRLQGDWSSDVCSSDLGGMAHAHVAVAVHHALVGENAVGGDEIVDQIAIHGSPRRRRRLGERTRHDERRDRAAKERAPAERRGLHGSRLYRRRASVARRSSRAPRNAASGGATGLSRRRTRPICRISDGSSRMAASRRAATSPFTENSEVTDSPSPASTNFFIASVLPSSIAARAVTRARANHASISRRTVLPRSNRISGCSASSAGRIGPCRRQRGAGGAMATSSSR